jgi:hypothetical protein
MAQLKVKQISDFVSAISNVHNGVAGTQTASDISNAKSGAISSAYSADVVALSSAKAYADQAEVDAINSAVSSAEAKDVARATVAATNLSNAVSTEKLRAEGAEGVNSTAISNEISRATEAEELIDGRVTTLLAGKTEALDTFGEIKTFIEALSTEDVTTIAAISTAVANDIVHSAAIATSLSVAIANDVLAQGYADDAQTAAEGTAAQNAADALEIVNQAKVIADAEAQLAADVAAVEAIEAAQAVITLAISVKNATEGYADTAEADAIASAKSYSDGLAVNYDANGSAAAALSAAKSDASAKDAVILSTLRGEIADLGAIDKLEQLAGNITAAGFKVAEIVSDENFDILVFVNGLQIHRSSETVDGFSTSNGSDFIVSGLGYDLDAEDHVVVIGSRA